MTLSFLPLRGKRGRIRNQECSHQNSFLDFAVYFSSTLDLTLVDFPVEGSRC